MAQSTIKKVKKPKKQKVKQGHKLVWFTLLIISLPIIIVGYVLVTSFNSGNKPVEGNRFSANDLNPKITQSEIDLIQGELLSIPGVESATINMNSATLRIHLNMNDGSSQEEINEAAESAYNIINNLLPIDTYFTNSDGSKNYDLEIDAYNFIIDEAHSAQDQIYIKITKTGAGKKVVDIVSQAKDPELVDQIMNPDLYREPEEVNPEETEETEGEEEYYYDEYGYYDQYGNFYYYE